MDNTTHQSMEKLEQGILSLFDSSRYQNYLKAMSHFHHYSYRNSILIYEQMPNATLVTGFRIWQTQFKRHVKRGEKGIRIFVPILRTHAEEDDSTPRFKTACVFDISQTEGEPLPTYMETELAGDVTDYPQFLELLKKISPVPIRFQSFEGSAKGAFLPEQRMIQIQTNLSQVQTIKTLLHEITHVTLKHDQTKTDPRIREIEAESVAYAVCSHYGIDTSGYSFGYIAGWSKDHSLQEFHNSLDLISRTTNEMITKIDQIRLPQEAVSILPTKQASSQTSVLVR